jgi:integrase
MASIKREPNGRWRARYRDPQGRSRSRNFPRRIDAQHFLERVGTQIQHDEWVDPSLRRSLFREWADLWWETTVRLRPTTRRGYHQLLYNQVLPYFGDRRVGTIDYMDVERFIADHLARGDIGAKKIRDAVSIVSLIMQGAVRTNARRDNPAAGHHVPLAKKRLRQGDVLDLEQAQRLVEHVRDPYKPAVWLLIFTGMRPAELCGLRVGSADLTRGVVHIVESLTPVSAYGEQAHVLVAGPPKTSAGDRSIPIPAWLCEDLAVMLAQRATEHGAPLSRTDHLFVTTRGTPLNRDKFRENVVRPALRAAGLPESIRTYDLRHAHASVLIDLGANVLAVAQRMGHADPGVTLRVYGHLFAGIQEELTRKLDECHQATLSGQRRSRILRLDECHEVRRADTDLTRADTKRGPRAVSNGRERSGRKGL